jgi:hypothetical protein
MPALQLRKRNNGGRLFKCLACELEANRDAVGVLNMSCLHGGGVNWVMAHPMLLRWMTTKGTMSNQ